MKQHILVIEDDPDHRVLIKTMLEKAGYKVFEAPNGKEGLQLFYQQPCNLVITDIFMPEKEGLETILELKRQFPTVKIIAISGGTRWSKHNGVDSALEAAQEFGANYILKKPIKIQQLLTIVDEILKVKDQ